MTKPSLFQKEPTLPTKQQFYPWLHEVKQRLPGLTPAQASLLASWSLGALLARSISLSAVTVALVTLRRQAPNTVRQRLREFYQDAADKRGQQRTAVTPSGCFGPLLQWLLDSWPPHGPRRLALAIDPTSLADRWTVLCVSVVYRGLAIPVAWAVLSGNQPEAWNPHWQRLLTTLKEQTPALAHWQVLVLGDRGLESVCLFRAIVGLGFHPLLRVKCGGRFRPATWQRFWPIAMLATPGRSRAVVGQAYAKHRLRCTLLTHWEEGQHQPWLLVTDLEPAAVHAAWYGYRAWIEHGFKLLKSGGWQWHQTRLSQTARVERQWLVLAVATLRLVQAGGPWETGVPPETVPDWPQEAARGAPARRQHSLFRLGCQLAALLAGASVPLGQLLVETWPQPPLHLLPLPPEPID